MVADLKVSITVFDFFHELNLFQNKLEIQYAAKRDALLSEVADLKQQLEVRHNETRSLNASIDSLKSVNEELKVWLGITFHYNLSDNFLARVRCYVCWYRRWQEPRRERTRS